MHDCPTAKVGRRDEGRTRVAVEIERAARVQISAMRFFRCYLAHPLVGARSTMDGIDEIVACGCRRRAEELRGELRRGVIISRDIAVAELGCRLGPKRELLEQPLGDATAPFFRSNTNVERICGGGFPPIAQRGLQRAGGDTDEFAIAASGNKPPIIKIFGTSVEVAAVEAEAKGAALR